MNIGEDSLRRLTFAHHRHRLVEVAEQELVVTVDVLLTTSRDSFVTDFRFIPRSTTYRVDLRVSERKFVARFRFRGELPQGDAELNRGERVTPRPNGMCEDVIMAWDATRVSYLPNIGFLQMKQQSDLQQNVTYGNAARL